MTSIIRLKVLKTFTAVSVTNARRLFMPIWLGSKVSLTNIGGIRDWDFLFYCVPNTKGPTAPTGHTPGSPAPTGPTTIKQTFDTPRSTTPGRRGSGQYPMFFYTSLHPMPKKKCLISSKKFIALINCNHIYFSI